MTSLKVPENYKPDPKQLEATRKMFDKLFARAYLKKMLAENPYYVQDPENDFVPELLKDDWLNPTYFTENK